jgi:hypothetical protein
LSAKFTFRQANKQHFSRIHDVANV